MAIGLVDWAGLGLPLMEYIFGPTPVISPNPSLRTAHETFFVEEALRQAQRVVDFPNETSIIFQHEQYGGYRMLYRLYYSTGQIYPTLKQAADRLIEVFRDPQLGYPSTYWDVAIMQDYVEGDENAGNFIRMAFFNPNVEGWAAYSLINPALEAAAVRKTKDIVKYYAATIYLNQQHQLPQPGAGAREGGVVMRWCFMYNLLWGAADTILMKDLTTGLPRLFTAAEMLEDVVVNMTQRKVPPDRPGFGWDHDAGGPGGHVGQQYIGNMNLAGSCSQGMARLDRYWKKLSTPDPRFFPPLKEYLDWLDFGFAPMVGQITSNPGSSIQTGGTQWVPGIGQYPSSVPRWRGGWRYYYYNNGNYATNGVHPETEAPLNGHVMSTYAHGYAWDPDTTARSRYLSRITEAQAGAIRWMQDNGGNPITINPRTWTEFAETWQEADGLVMEADGVIIPPGGEDMDVVPTNPAINEVITVTITGGPGTRLDWVAIAPVGSPLSTYLDWKYLASNSQATPAVGVADGVVTLTAPSSPGSYEVRFLLDDAFVLVPDFTPVLILVGGGGPQFQATLSLNGDVNDLYTVDLSTSPNDEYDVRWFVNDDPYPPVPVGAIRKPAGKRFFADANGRARYLTGLHNWNNISSWGMPPTTVGNPPSAFDYAAYLQRLIDEGHTATRFWCLGDFVRFIGGAPPFDAFRTTFPWARSSTPGAADGGNKWNLSVFDPVWFGTLRTRVQLAHEAGLTCVVMLFNAWDSFQNTSGTNIWHANNNVTVDGDPNQDGSSREAYNLTTVPPALLNVQKAFMHEVVDTLNDLDHVVWEIVNEPSGFGDGWVAHMIADLRSYESSQPNQHPFLQGFYAHSGTGSTNQQLWNLSTDAVAPGSLAEGGASPDGSGDYLSDPPAASGDKVVVLDTDHLFGVGGDRDLIWKAFCRGLNPIYMDTTLDTEFLNPGTPAPQYQRARDAMGQTALLARRFRNDLNTLVPQAQGTATPANTGYCLRTVGNDPIPGGPLPYEGWGAGTTGGTGHPDVHVTNLNDSGAGSLRAALINPAGNRNIVFDVGGTITLLTPIPVAGDNWTIDGFSAPSPITITGWGLQIITRDQFIIRQIRFRDVGVLPSEQDAIQITESNNFVISQVSVFNATDGNIDISGGCEFGTVQWCLMYSGKQMLIGSTDSTPDKSTERISLHHNAFIGESPTGANGGTDRSPLVRAGGYNPVAMTVDIRCNIFHGWLRSNCTKLEDTAECNLINNVYIPASDTSPSNRASSVQIATPANHYTSGNIDLGAAPANNYNTYGTKPTPWSVPTTVTQDAMTAAELVVANAGVLPRDATDLMLLARLPITGQFPVVSDAGEYLVYRPVGGPNPVTVDLSTVSPSIDIGYVWIHPVTGVVGASGDVVGGAVRNFTPPDGSDWVLFVRRLDLPYSLFGVNGTEPVPGNLGVGTFTVRADIYEFTNGSLLGTRELVITNTPPNGAIIWPPPGYVFRPDTPTHTSDDFLILQPQTAGILGVQFRIQAVQGGTPAVNVGAEITVPETDGTYRHDPFVHAGVYGDGDYDIDAEIRDASGTSLSPRVRVTINNLGTSGVKRQGRRLRGRLP